MQLAIGSDHAGYALKHHILGFLRDLGHDVLDCGVDSGDTSVDYPDWAQAVGEAIQQGKAERGILICGSGVGISIAANKMKGIYAAICHDVYSAHQGVEHDNMNVLCMGGKVIGTAHAEELCKAFVGAEFEGADRFVRRLNKIKALEDQL